MAGKRKHEVVRVVCPKCNKLIKLMKLDDKHYAGNHCGMEFALRIEKGY